MWLFRNRDVRQFVVIKFGSLNHREFRFKTTFKRKRWAECRFCRTALTETAGTTSGFHHHLKITAKLFVYI